METDRKISIGIKDEIYSANVGLIIICAYFVLEFGSFQGLYPIFKQLKVPFLLAVISIFYSIICIIQRKSRINILILLSLIFMLVHSYVTTIDPHARNNIIILFTTYIAYYIIVSSSVHKSSELILLLDGLLASVAFSCVHGICQGGLVWSNTWLGDENQFSVLCVMCFPLAYYLYIISTNKIKRYCYLICMILYISLITVALSRGGILALFVVIFYLWMKLQHKIRWLVALILCSALIVMFAPPKLLHELENIYIDEQKGSEGERLYLWRLGLDMFLDNPVIGVGLHNYGELYTEYDRRRERRDTTGGYTWRGHKWVLHSTPITIITEMGLIGCLLFVMLQTYLYRSVRDLYRNKSKSFIVHLSTANFLSQIGFWVGSMFLSLLITPFFWLLVILSEAIKNCSVVNE